MTAGKTLAEQAALRGEAAVPATVVADLKSMQKKGALEPIWESVMQDKSRLRAGIDHTTGNILVWAEPADAKPLPDGVAWTAA